MNLFKSDDKVISIGECMVELKKAGDLFAMAFSGDTLNMAVYASRLGANVEYLTALGDDKYSSMMQGVWDEEGVKHSNCVIAKNRTPGLYMIDVDSKGERSFYYWRSNSPARELFEIGDAADLEKTICEFNIIYLSGITLSLYSDNSLDVFYNILNKAKQKGAQIVFDGNFRPKGWPDIEKARKVFEKFLSISDVVMPTYDDEVMLFGDSSIASCISRIKRYNPKEIVVKNGPDGCYIWQESLGDVVTKVDVPYTVEPIDTCAAGDSFNGSYLASRINGLEVKEAALVAHKVAGEVIKYPGAIIAKDVMPKL